MLVVVVVGQSSEAVLEAEERMARNQGGPALAKNLIRKVPGITWGRQIVPAHSDISLKILVALSLINLEAEGPDSDG